MNDCAVTLITKAKGFFDPALPLNVAVTEQESATSGKGTVVAHVDSRVGPEQEVFVSGTRVMRVLLLNLSSFFAVNCGAPISIEGFGSHETAAQAAVEVLPSWPVDVRIIVVTKDAFTSPRGWEDGPAAADMLIASLNTGFENTITFQLGDYIETVEPDYFYSDYRSLDLLLRAGYGQAGSLNIFIVEQIRGGIRGMARDAKGKMTSTSGALISARRLWKKTALVHEIGHLIGFDHTAHPRKEYGEIFGDVKVLVDNPYCEPEWAQTTYVSYEKGNATEDARTNVMYYRSKSLEESRLFTPEYEVPFKTIVNCFLQTNSLVAPANE